MKGATSGKEQRVTGEFDGDITHFTLHEDALDVLFPKLNHDAIYWHNDAVPGVPQHFRLPASGTIASGSLTISLDPSVGETIDNENNAVWSSHVLVPPYLLAPLVQKFSLPYKSMTWVVSKALGGKAARLVIIVDLQYRASYVQRTIKRPSQLWGHQHL